MGESLDEMYTSGHVIRITLSRWLSRAAAFCKNLEDSASTDQGCNLNARGKGERLLWDMDEYTL